MANPVDVTVTQEALGQMKALRTETIKAQEAVLKLADDALKASKNISSISTPSRLSANSANNANTTASIQKQTAIIVESQNKIQQAYERSRLAEIKLAQQREKSVDTFVRNEAKEQQALQRSESAYNRIQASVTILTKTYQDLAIRKQLGNTLTVKEEAQLLSLTNRLNQYQSALKKVDADIQKNQRNVGNYASGFNGLGNSINQITRELPAFTFSAQTGFLALSNNIPILTDEIGKLVRQNKELASQGQPVKSVLSQILSGVFSLQTAMGLGILAFTLYGKEISSFITGLFKGSKAMDTFAESTKLMTEASKEGAKNAVQETLALQSNLSIARDVTLSYKERLIAVDNLQKQYPFYFENLTKEQILAGDTAKAENALTQAILSRAKANASISKITENQARIIDLEEERLPVLDRIKKANSEISQLESLQKTGNLKNTNSLLIAYREQESALKRYKDISIEISDLNTINNRLSTYALENEKSAIGLDYTNTKATKENTRRKIETIEIERKGYASIIENLEKQIALMTELQKANSGNLDEWNMFQVTIDNLNRSLSAIKKGYDDLRESAKKGQSEAERDNEIWKESEERLRLLRKATEDYIETLSGSFFKDAGLGSLQIFFDNTFNRLMFGADTLKEKFAVTFLAISEVAKEAFNFINKASQQNFDAEYRRLELQKEVAVKFAGESTSAQERITTEYDRRKKEIQRREAEAQKKIAVFNILINTAQGVVSALASTPPNVPLSIAIGLIGALQAGIVQAQPIPQFFEGGTHKGGIMMVNDAKGNSYKETIVTPDGKVIKPQGRNVLMNAPAGTNIFTPEQWKEKENALGNILSERGISFNPNVMRNFAFGGNTGLSKSDFDNGISQLQKSLKNMPSSHISFDEKGIRKFDIEKGIRKERLNRRFNIG